MKQYFNVNLWFTTPRTSKTLPRGRTKLLKSALCVWFTNYEILTRNEETWQWMAGWLVILRTETVSFIAAGVTFIRLNYEHRCCVLIARNRYPALRMKEEGTFETTWSIYRLLRQRVAEEQNPKHVDGKKYLCLDLLLPLHPEEFFSLFFVFLPCLFVLFVLVILVSLSLSPSVSSSPPRPPLSSPFRSSSSLSLYIFSGNPLRIGWQVGPLNVRFASFVLCLRQNSDPNFWYWNSLSLPAEWWNCCCGRTTW